MPKNLHWPATSLSFLTQYSVHTNYTLMIQSSKQSELYQLLTYDLTTLDHLHVGTQANIAHQHWMTDEFMISNCSLLFWKKLFKKKMQIFVHAPGIPLCFVSNIEKKQKGKNTNNDKHDRITIMQLYINDLFLFLDLRSRQAVYDFTSLSIWIYFIFFLSPCLGCLFAVILLQCFSLTLNLPYSYGNLFSLKRLPRL